MRIGIPVSLFILLSLATGLVAPGQEKTQKAVFRLSGPVLENKAFLPQKYACDGANLSPPLRFENIPTETKSLALILDDLDAPRGSYVHWILWNIDPGAQEIEENALPAGAVQGMNDFKKTSYGGPCPPGKTHRYVFKAYALDTSLILSPISSKADLEKAMEGHILARTQFIAHYKKKGKESR
jgi:Raf kinase inhibitor-like YbhB/YbcL family protein